MYTVHTYHTRRPELYMYTVTALASCWIHGFHPLPSLLYFSPFTPPSPLPSFLFFGSPHLGYHEWSASSSQRGATGRVKKDGGFTTDATRAVMHTQCVYYLLSGISTGWKRDEYSRVRCSAMWYHPASSFAPYVLATYQGNVHTSRGWVYTCRSTIVP